MTNQSLCIYVKSQGFLCALYDTRHHSLTQIISRYSASFILFNNRWQLLMLKGLTMYAMLDKYGKNA